jgi:OTU domain-containing protein 6
LRHLLASNLAPRHAISQVKRTEALKASTRSTHKISRHTVSTAVVAAGLACFAGAGASSAQPAPAVTDEQPEWAVLRIAGDGRCMFRACAHGAHLAALADRGLGPELLPPEAELAAADALRGAVCDALLAGEREGMEAFIDTDEAGSYEEYVRRMRRPGAWGGEPELSVAARVLARPVSVYMDRRRQLELVSAYDDGTRGSGEGGEPKHAVTLLFHGGGHYDLLVRGGPARPPPAARAKL